MVGLCSEKKPGFCSKNRYNSVGRVRERLAIGIFVVSVVFFASSCASIFYFPDSEEYSDISALPFRQAEFNLPVGAPSQGFVNGNWLFSQGTSKGVIVHFHGNAQNLTAHLAFSHWLPQLGYDLVVFDYQGYGKSSGKVTREATIANGVEVLKYVLLKSPPNVPIFVFAQSLGGAIGIASYLELTKGEKSRICGLVLESTFSSYRELVRLKIAQFGSLWILQYPLSWLFSDAGSPAPRLGEVNTNVLVLHGQQDEVVPLAAGKALMAGLASANARMYVHPQGGHTPFFVRADSSWRNKLLDYLGEAECNSKN